MSEWILIIAMLSPGGDFIRKETVVLANQKECEAVKKQLPTLVSPLGVQRKGVCVTKDHWDGKKKMPNVAYD